MHLCACALETNNKNIGNKVWVSPAEWQTTPATKMSEVFCRRKFRIVIYHKMKKRARETKINYIFYFIYLLALACPYELLQFIRTSKGWGE